MAPLHRPLSLARRIRTSSAFLDVEKGRYDKWFTFRSVTIPEIVTPFWANMQKKIDAHVMSASFVLMISVP
jgi:hypothetical protein